MRKPLPPFFIPLWLAIFIDSLGFGLAYPLITLIFTSDAHPLLPSDISQAGRYFALGLSYLLYPLGLFFASNLLEFLGRRFGKKQAILIASFGIFLAFFLMGLGSSYASLSLLLIGRLGSGVFGGIQSLSQGLVLDQHPHPNLKRYLKRMSQAVGAGIIAGPILGGLLADRGLLPFFQDATPFYFAALFMGATGILLVYRLPSTRPESPKPPLEFFKPIRLLFEATKLKRITQLATLFLFSQLSFGIFYQMLQILMAKQFQYQALDLGLLNAALGVSFAVGIWICMKYLIHPSPHHRLASAALLLVGISQLLLCLTSGHKVFFLLSMLCGCFHMIAFLLLSGIFSRAMEPTHRAWIMGVYAATLTLSWALSGLSTNLLSLISGSQVLFLGAIFALLASFLLLTHAKKHRSSS